MKTTFQNVGIDTQVFPQQFGVTFKVKDRFFLACTVQCNTGPRTGNQT